MKGLLVLAGVLAMACLSGASTETLPLLAVGSGAGSEVFSNVVVTSVTTTHVYFTHSRGLGSAKLKNLPPDLQKHFHYDPVKAEAIQAQQSQANALFSLYMQEVDRQAAARRRARALVEDSEEDVQTTTRPDCPVSPNPSPMSGDTQLTLRNLTSHRLFASGGPSKDDVFEGAVGDCYFLATVAALAEMDPDFIRKTVTRAGDGTYVVRFFRRDGTPSYVRVTPELWYNGYGVPQYARLGQQGCLWVPILEKAFALCRRNPSSYDSINGGGGRELNRLVWKYGDIPIEQAGISEEEFIKWFRDGAPEGTLKTTIYKQIRQFLSEVDARRQSGKGVVLGGPVTFTDATPLEPSSAGFEKSTYHRAQHIYMVDHVEKDADGVCVALVLRDPWGLYRTIKDPARLFFCTGGAATVEMPE
jgi:hypothetical protein